MDSRVPANPEGTAGHGKLKGFAIINRFLPNPSVLAHTLSQLMHPEHANLLGNVHGGWIMKLVDEAGALTCMRHAQRKVVTVTIDSMDFRQPIRIGDLVILHAEVSYTGRTSMEAAVEVHAENPITGEQLTQTLHGLCGLDDSAGHSVPRLRRDGRQAKNGTGANPSAAKITSEVTPLRTSPSKQFLTPLSARVI
jgi:uncharacterized protein (TIGR00369 family)